jgi:hypothetical protein
MVLYTPSQLDIQGSWPMVRPYEGSGKNRCAAIVTAVHGDRMVSLVVFDANGKIYPVWSVNLFQPEDTVNMNGRYCEWMEYQKGQDAKAKEQEKALEKAE